MEPGPHTPTILGLLNFMAVLVVSVAFHEMAHAFLADRFGDPTPRQHGRMTLNLFAHLHPIFSIAVPAVFWWSFGGLVFMGLTPVNPSRMRRPRLHGMLTSLGGPVASLLLGLVFLAALVGFVVAVNVMEGPVTEGHRTFAGVLGMGVQLNCIGAVFNMLPVPPLDGSHVLEFFLPRWIRPAWAELERNAWMLFALLMFTGALRWIIEPAMAVSGDLVGAAIELGKRLAHG